MLSENLKHFRKAKGLSQEELAIKLHIVRQTVSKWEKGLSVPDSGMLIRLAEALDTSVTERSGGKPAGFGVLFRRECRAESHCRQIGAAERTVCSPL